MLNHQSASVPGLSPDSPAAAPRRCGLLRLRAGCSLRRRTRCALRIVVILPLLLVLSALIAVQSPLVGEIVAREVSAKIGCEFTGRGSLQDMGSKLVISKPRLIVHGLEGEAARFMEAERAEIDLDWTRGLFAGPRPTKVRLFSPVLRVSVGIEDGTLNLEGLDGDAEASEAASLPPAVDIIDGRLELGEHSAATGLYTVLTSVPVSGELAPVPGHGDAPVYGVRLSQTGPVRGGVETGRIGMLLEGQIDLSDSDAELALRNLSLNDWPPEVIPTSLRDIWRRLNIQGTVSEATLRYTHDGGAVAAVALDGVSMDALVPADRPGSGVDKPLKLTGVTGTIKLSRGGIDALLEGVVGDLPGRVSLRTTGTRLDAPLRCEITTNRFAVSQSPELMPYAPRIVRKRFASFSGPTALVDARVLIERGAAIDGAPAPLKTSGSIAFENGRASFEKFPYPFEDIHGLVTFTDEKIEFVNIQGRGPTGAIMSAEGIIAPVNDDPRVLVDVLVLDMPVDHVLRDAMPGSRRAIVDELFNQERYDELVAQGLVLTPERRDELGAELDAARRERESARGGAIGEIDQRIAGLEAALLAPVFELGGLAQVAVQVTRDEGLDAPFGHTVEVRLPRAGVLPDGFPLPIIAHDLVLHIGDEEARLGGGTFEGLAGGRADITAHVDLRDENDQPTLRPNITVRAEGIPVDALLLSAIPDREPPPPTSLPAAGGTEAGGGAFSVAELLTGLNLDGTVNFDAAITPATGERAAAGKEVSVDVLVGLADLRARPGAAGGAGALVMDNMTGSIRVTDTAVTVADLRARLARADAGDGDAGEITVDAVAGLGDASTLSAAVLAGNLDMAAPLELLVSAVSPKAGKLVGGIRAKQKTAGRIDARIDVTQNGAAPAEVGVRIDGARGLEFDALGGRFGVTTTGGAAAMSIGRDTDEVAFDGLAGEVAFNGQRMMTVELDGATPLLSSASAPVDPGEHNTLAVRMSGARIESDLSRAALKAILDASAAKPAKPAADGAAPKAGDEGEWAWLEKMDPRGEFDADLAIRPRAIIAPAPGKDVAGNLIVGAGIGAGPAAIQPEGGSVAVAKGPGVRAGTGISLSRYAASGSLWPRSISAVYNGALVDLPSITGRIVLEERGGRFEKLRAAAAEEKWHLGIDGTWQSRREAWGTGVKVDSVISLAGSRLENSLTALLPKGVRGAMDRAKLRMDGPFSIDGAKLAFWVPTGESAKAAAKPDAPVTSKNAPPPPPRVALGNFLFDGQLQLTDLTANVGVPVRYGAGLVEVVVQQNNGEVSPTVDVTLRADTLAVGGVPMTGARGRLVSGSRPGQLLVPQFVAECLGGRMSLTGVLEGITASREGGLKVGTGTGYQLSATVAGTRFAPLLASIQAAQASPPKPGAPKVQARSIDINDESRGRVDASVSLSGTLGKDDSRVGRGSVRIAGGDVVQLPGVVRMVELSNLQVPSAERLDYVQAGFDLKGKRVTFEEVAVMSESLTITGDGTITMPEMNLDFRFNSQAAPGRRIPLVSGLFEAVRNELVTTVVGGTIKKPKVRTESLSGTRRMFSGIFGGGNEPKLDAKSVARSARTERDRLRSQPTSPGMVAPAVTLPGKPIAPPVRRGTGLSKAESPAGVRAPSGDLR